MTQYKVEHLHYTTHLVNATEQNRAIVLITINSNPPRWIASDSNPEHEYKMVFPRGVMLETEAERDRVLCVVKGEAKEKVAHLAYNTT
jgi:hypothetical protein